MEDTDKKGEVGKSPIASTNILVYFLLSVFLCIGFFPFVVDDHGVCALYEDLYSPLFHFPS